MDKLKLGSNTRSKAWVCSILGWFCVCSCNSDGLQGPKHDKHSAIETRGGSGISNWVG